MNTRLIGLTKITSIKSFLSNTLSTPWNRTLALLNWQRAILWSTSIWRSWRQFETSPCSCCRLWSVICQFLPKSCKKVWSTDMKAAGLASCIGYLLMDIGPNSEKVEESYRKSYFARSKERTEVLVDGGSQNVSWLCQRKWRKLQEVQIFTWHQSCWHSRHLRPRKIKSQNQLRSCRRFPHQTQRRKQPWILKHPNEQKRNEESQKNGRTAMRSRKNAAERFNCAGKALGSWK